MQKKRGRGPGLPEGESLGLEEDQGQVPGQGGGQEEGRLCHVRF